MSDRPYQDYSELELFDLLRIYEKGVQETERERNEFLNRGFDLDFPDVRELKSRLDSQSETCAN